MLLDRWKLHTPLVSEMLHVAQCSPVLSTLLVGGIPLMEALETAGESSSKAKR